MPRPLWPFLAGTPDGKADDGSRELGSCSDRAAPSRQRAQGFWHLVKRDARRRDALVGSHNLSSQNVELRVSNPRTIAYECPWEVQISQGMGTFFQIELLKTGRMYECLKSAGVECAGSNDPPFPLDLVTGFPCGVKGVSRMPSQA